MLTTTASAALGFSYYRIAGNFAIPQLAISVINLLHIFVLIAAGQPVILALILLTSWSILTGIVGFAACWLRGFTVPPKFPNTERTAPPVTGEPGLNFFCVFIILLAAGAGLALASVVTSCLPPLGDDRLSFCSFLFCLLYVAGQFGLITKALVVLKTSRATHAVVPVSASSHSDDMPPPYTIAITQCTADSPPSYTDATASSEGERTDDPMPRQTLSQFRGPFYWP
ncbi:uncharacterized protein LOC129600666 [Paramacrobiotus metropolitanus]|uniref:uncharacterized protein LOC129600666 n=1 Tax=Paramacrobiotus metropolitanus TaxID=2943436 RepID=UPI0024460987|nr:uncharacterized protein LOC129600666 [Paramacrobiotus metropolitanus]